MFVWALGAKFLVAKVEYKPKNVPNKWAKPQTLPVWTSRERLKVVYSDQSSLSQDPAASNYLPTWSQISSICWWYCSDHKKPKYLLQWNDPFWNPTVVGETMEQKPNGFWGSKQPNFDCSVLPGDPDCSKRRRSTLLLKVWPLSSWENILNIFFFSENFTHFNW